MPSSRETRVSSAEVERRGEEPAGDDDEQQEEDDVGDRHDRRGPDHRSARPDHGCAHHGQRQGIERPLAERQTVQHERDEDADDRPKEGVGVRGAPRAETVDPRVVAGEVSGACGGGERLSMTDVPAAECEPQQRRDDHPAKSESKQQIRHRSLPRVQLRPAFRRVIS
ncbi:hypothetical protein [Roseiarcus sp.]|uniref:hypothetical protein n=1 Tax=Roseiarcus sp. TaxID=1969460 RepID=UPI003F9A027D